MLSDGTAQLLQLNLWLLGKSGFTSATLEAICITEDARRDQALHLPGRVCVTLVKKSPGRNLPYAYASATKARSTGLCCVC